MISKIDISNDEETIFNINDNLEIIKDEDGLYYIITEDVFHHIENPNDFLNLFKKVGEAYCCYVFEMGEKSLISLDEDEFNAVKGALGYGRS